MSLIKRYFESSLIITNIRVWRLFLVDCGAGQRPGQKPSEVCTKLNKIFKYILTTFTTFITQLLTVNYWTIKCIPFIKRILCVEGIKIFKKFQKVRKYKIFELLISLS